MKKTTLFPRILLIILVAVSFQFCQDELMISDSSVDAEISSKQLKSINDASYLYDLIEIIEGMVEDGLINNGNGNSLISKIENAIKSYEKGNIKAAENKLNALLNEINAFINTGTLTEEDVQELLDLTVDIVEGIYEPVYGDILITEVMMNPAVIPDYEGEWIEVYNCSDHNIDLKHLIVNDRVGSFIINEILVIGPGEYCVFETHESATSVIGYVYDNQIHLNNGGDMVALVYQGTELAKMVYGSGQSGRSRMLKSEFFNVEDAKFSINWPSSSTSTLQYRPGNYGTPGAANDF